MRDFLKSLDRTTLYWTAAALIGVFYTLGCLHEIANYWQWGHNGFNGSSYIQAAVNSIRFGIFGQAKFHYSLQPPGSEDIFTHHPMLIHFHLVPLVWLAGPVEWVGRLVPAIYSILNLGILFVIVRHYYGDAVALIAAAFFACLPINLIYANMIDHEQGGMFWCLLALFTYTRWAETHARRFFWGTMAAITMAVQFEWVGYYIALFAVIHAFYEGLRHADGIEWRPEFTFVAVFSVVVLANAALFFSYIHWGVGGAGDMATSFSVRTASPEGYWSILWEQLTALYGLLPLTLLALWLLVFTVRLVRWEVHYGDLFPLFFLLAQIIHSTVFKQAGRVHYYWIYYLGPAAAIAAGHLLWSAVRVIRAYLETWDNSSPSDQKGWANGATTVVLALGVVAVPLGVQAQYGYVQLQRGSAVAGAMSYETYDDQFDDIMWVKELTQMYDRSNTDFLIHFNNEYRAEWYRYLDAPHRRWRRLSFSEELESKERHQVLLVDLRKVEQRARLNELVHNYGTTMFDRTFLAIDATEPGGDFEAWDRRELNAGPLWDWFVNDRRPPVKWVPDQRFSEPSKMFPRGVKLEPSFIVGGDGGQPVRWHCPVEMHLRGFRLGLREPASPKLAWVEPVCVPRDGGKEPAGFVGPTIGLKPPSPTVHRSLCSRGAPVVGLHGRAGLFVDATGVLCQPSEDPVVEQRVIGGPGGDPFSRRCPDDTFAWGFRSRAGDWLDGLGLVCRSADALDAGE